MKVWRLLGQYNSVTTTFTALAGTPASPYTPDFSGRLIGLRILPSRNTAASLIDGGSIKLTCTTFTPNTVEVPFSGSGLQTAPAAQPMPLDYDLDQPVSAGVPITIEGRNITTSTPVTVSVFVSGLFST